MAAEKSLKIPILTSRKAFLWQFCCLTQMPLTKLCQNHNKQFIPLLTRVPVKENALSPADRLELPAARQPEQQGVSRVQR